MDDREMLMLIIIYGILFQRNRIGCDINHNVTVTVHSRVGDASYLFSDLYRPYSIFMTIEVMNYRTSWKFLISRL